ncbi:surface protein [Streptomyces gobitricini]|uniref:Uncharacterized protein n=1 Tax=Streptomyces gobitricini TaxID=68211 RepID=A0ABP5ZPK6_9ACTN
MVTSLLERRDTTPYEPVPEDAFLVPLLLLAGEADDDVEPHICRGID